jgi:hypothetical protein
VVYQMPAPCDVIIMCVYSHTCNDYVDALVIFVGTPHETRRWCCGAHDGAFTPTRAITTLTRAVASRARELVLWKARHKKASLAAGGMQA